MKFTSQLTVVENDNAGIPVPQGVVAALGGGNHPKVSLTLNGFTYRSSIAKMGDGFWIPVSKARRKAGNLEVDVPYEINIELDTAPRIVEIPEELAVQFQSNPEAKARWDALSYSNQLRMVTPINNAKQQETRDRNVTKIIGQLQGDS